MSMDLLSRDQILGQVLLTKDVPVPEWGKNAGVRIRELNGAQRFRLTSQTQRKGQNSYGNELCFIFGVIGKDGQPLFTEQDAKTLADRLGHKVINRIAAEILELSGIGTDEVEEEAKNSEAPESDEPGSDSPLHLDDQ